MSAALAVLGVLAGIVIGILIGLKAGARVRGRSRVFWLLNIAAFLVGMAVDFTGLVFGQLWLSFGALGLLGGALTGLKYGYSESIGIWRTIDTWTGTDRLLRPPDEHKDGVK